MAAPPPSATTGAAAADGSSTGNPFRDFLEQQQAASDATPGLCPTGSTPLAVDTTLPVRWMKQEKNGAWTALRRRDSARVEAAFLAWEASQEQRQEVGQQKATTTALIEGNRYEADIPARQIRAAYWDNDSKPLLRASWFSKPATALPGGGASGFVPYSETDAAAIEEAYQAALDETVRSLAAGSFLPPSANEGAGGLSASTSASASASCSASGSKGGGSGASRVLLRKEMPLSDGTNKVVIIVREVAASVSASASKSAAAASSSSAYTVGAAQPSTNKLGLALLSPAIEVEVTQQRVQYGIGVLHNRLLRRGLDTSLEPPPTLGGTQSGGAKGEGVEGAKDGVENEEEEEDEFDREPAQLVFVVHGIGEKMWASEMIQGALSLRASVEMMRANFMEQQVRILESNAGGDPTAPPAPCKAATAVCKKQRGGSQGCVDEEGQKGLAGGGRMPPSEEATETADAAAAADGEEAYDKSSTAKKQKQKKTRVEFVPVEWFDAIRSDEGSLTRKTQRVTLPTVPLFRQLANDVVMDVLLYMNPSHRQRILAVIGERMNKAYARFKEAHPSFSGRVSVVGHSLGSVILFDLLAHQRGHGDDRVFSPLDAAIHYPQLKFPIDLFMTMGSPIGLFLVVREQELPPTFKFPTVERFYNLFHPYDPVAYRIEPILQPAMSKLDPALVPHHATGAGEKTFVTRAREQKRLVQGNLAALGSTVTTAGKSFLSSLSSLATPRAAFAMGGTGPGSAEDAGAALLAGTGGDPAALGVAMTALAVGGDGNVGGAGMDDSAAQAEPRVEALRLNGGKRFDYAIQEGVGESLNEYISAISSHACYFAHPDVSYFLVRLLYRLDESNGGGGDGEGKRGAMALSLSASSAAAVAEGEVMRV